MAQHLSIYFTDGTALQYEIADLRSSGLDSNSVHVALTDGNTFSWSLSSVQRMDFHEVSTGVPATEELTSRVLDVFPDPVSDATRIVFHMDVPGHARVAIYDMEGREVRVVHDGFLPAGDTALRWTGVDGEGRPLANGTYVCQVVRGGLRASRNVVIVR